MKPAPAEIRDLGLVRRIRDEDDDEDIQKPLEWSLIRRLFTYAAPVQKKLTALSVMTVIRGAQLPALALAAPLHQRRRIQALTAENRPGLARLGAVQFVEDRQLVGRRQAGRA